MNSIPRRQFIKHSTLLLAGGTSLIINRSAGGAGVPASRNVIACRDSHLKATAQPDCWSALKFIGAPGVEVNINASLQCAQLFHPTRKYDLSTPEGIQLLQDDLKANGITITAFCMNNRLDEQLEREVEWLRKLVPVVQKFGVKAIRLDVVPRALKRDQFLPFAIKACKQLCDIVAGTPVRLAIENHSNTTNDPAFLEKLFDGVDSDHLGLTLDPANLYWFGHPLNDVYSIIEKFAARAFHTHMKTIRYPEDRRNTRRPMGWEYDKHTVPVGEGDIDYPRVVATLRKANYPGDFCLENECLGHFPKDQQPEVLKKEIAYLAKL